MSDPDTGPPYWLRFAGMTVVLFAALLVFVLAFLPQRFVLDLDFNESGYSFPMIEPPPPGVPPAPGPVRRPNARGPAVRVWDEYLRLLDEGEPAAAVHRLRTYLESRPGDLGALAEYARALWRADRLAGAGRAYERALELGAGPDIRRELARLRVAQRRWDEALEEYRRLLESSPRDSSLMREYARTATWAERYELALQLYERLIESGADDAETRLEWARVLYWANRPRAALELLAGLPSGLAPADSLRAALRASVDTLSAVDSAGVGGELLPTARRLVLGGAPDSALVLYRKHLAERVGADSVLLEMADVFEFRLDAPDSAIVALRTYLQRQPGDQVARLRLARLLAWSGRADAARAAAESIRTAEPGNADAWALLGDLHRWEGDRDRARSAYRRALDADPDHPSAKVGLATLQEEVRRSLAREGTVGPSGLVEFFSDSEDFTRMRWNGGWRIGNPVSRIGVRVALERLRGHDPRGSRMDLTGVALAAVAERWWLMGEIRTAGEVGIWATDAGGSEPVFALVVDAPDWRGAGYRFEYRHGPAHVETSTLEAAATDLRTDVLSLARFWPFASGWDLQTTARLGRVSGFEHENLRADATLGIYHRPDRSWRVGFETRWLGFTEAAPRPGRRLYWDPEFFWSHSAVLEWGASSPKGWRFSARVRPGIAWIRERDREPGTAFVLSAGADVRRRFGPWTLFGAASASQSRAGEYRALALELGLTRRLAP